MRHAADDERWMRLAIDEARGALRDGPIDVPIGAVVVDEHGEVIGAGCNERELRQDPTAHAEVVAMRMAAEQRGDWHLESCTLVVTLEPCPMCAGAALAARIPRVVLGAWDAKAGAAGSVVDLLRERRLPHQVEVVGGVLEGECAALLGDFFVERRR